MIRKFKHRKLGWIANVGETSWANVTDGTVSHPIISKKLIENSCDWEEIIDEVLFTTYDGVKVTNQYNDTLYSCLKNIKCRGEQILHYNVNKWYHEGRKEIRLVFADKAKCQEYINNNVPKFNIQQVKDALEKYSKILYIPTEPLDFKNEPKLMCNVKEVLKELGIC